MLLLFGLTLLPHLVFGLQKVFDLDANQPTNDLLEAAYNARIMKSCRSCQAILLPLKQLATIGDDSFVSAMVKICKARKVGNHKRHIFYLLNKKKQIILKSHDFEKIIDNIRP